MKGNVMDEKYKDHLKQCCLYRWDAWVDKQKMARSVVNTELGARSLSRELKNMPWEEEHELIEELVLELLSNR